MGRSTKAAGGSPTPVDSLSKLTRDAPENEGSRGACGRRAQGTLQNISRLPFRDPGQGEHLATKAYGLAPRNKSKNELEGHKPLRKKERGGGEAAEIQMLAGKLLSNVQMLSAEVFRWLTGLIRGGRCE